MSKQQKKAFDIVRCLCEEGWEAYIVGGAARDLLNGETPDDYDVVTQAPYEIVRELFKNQKISYVDASFKICIVDGIEVSTYRRDTCFGLLETDCEIKKAKTIREDLARRDLTINALAFCPYNGQIIDEFGGLDDLQNCIIRFTGNPDDRISEDPCRILRACRFLAKMKGRFDSLTLKALKKHCHLVKENIAPERMRLEILKALKYQKPSLFFDALHEIGSLRYLSPAFEDCYGHDGGHYHNETIDEHIKLVGDSLSARRPLLRLAGYFHDHGKPSTAAIKNEKLSFIRHASVGEHIVETELKRLRFGLKEIAYVKALIKHHMLSFEHTDRPVVIRRILKGFKEDGIDWKDWIQLRIADRKENLEKRNYDCGQIKNMVLNIRDQLKPSSKSAALSIRDLAVNGRDIMKTLNIKPGPEVGRILNQLLEYVIDHPELNTREKLLQQVILDQ